MGLDMIPETLHILNIHDITWRCGQSIRESSTYICEKSSYQRGSRKASFPSGGTFFLWGILIVSSPNIDRDFVVSCPFLPFAESQGSWSGRLSSKRCFLSMVFTFFVPSVLFTDEAAFTRNDKMNFHNNHFWAEENSHSTVQPQHHQQFNISVWAGVVADPHVWPQRLRGNSYRYFFENDLPTLLEDPPLTITAHMWCMHDGAPPHSLQFENSWTTRTLLEVQVKENLHVAPTLAQESDPTMNRRKRVLRGIKDGQWSVRGWMRDEEGWVDGRWTKKRMRRVASGKDMGTRVDSKP